MNQKSMKDKNIVKYGTEHVIQKTEKTPISAVRSSCSLCIKQSSNTSTTRQVHWCNRFLVLLFLSNEEALCTCLHSNLCLSLSNESTLTLPNKSLRPESMTHPCPQVPVADHGAQGYTTTMSIPSTFFAPQRTCSPTIAKRERASVLPGFE